MFEKLPFVCPTCRTSHVAEYDPAGVKDLGRWKPLLRCNRCADYLDAKNRLNCKLASLCRSLAVTREAHHGKLPTEIESEARLKLERLTGEFARLVCDHARLETLWDQDFVEQLLEHPGRCNAVVQAYLDGIRRLAK
jgi:hypothetical protein